MHNKSLVIKIFIIAGSVVAAAYLLFAFVFFTKKTDKDICKGVNIRILNDHKMKMLSEQTVADFVCNGSLNPIGKRIADVETEKIEQELLHENPTLQNAECYITPSGVMKIDVMQRTPKFRV
ncbi:MAG: hypothetical protein LBB41_02820, partial [Prevotellaceae bacterium]|nr:hypothetical protein [Prevotellaceae bacterium]